MRCSFRFLEFCVSHLLRNYLSEAFCISLHSAQDEDGGPKELV